MAKSGNTKIIREREFARRLRQACDIHPHVPPMNRGRQVWIRDHMTEQGAGVSLESVRKWHAGEARPRPDKMKVLARILHADEAWLSLGILPEMTAEEKRTRSAALSGSVNVAVGFLQMAGAQCAFPEPEDVREDSPDLYAIIRGRHMAIGVVLGASGEEEVRFQAPTNHDRITVLGLVQTGFSSVDMFVLPSEVISGGTPRGGYIEVAAKRSGSEWATAGGRLKKVLGPEQLMM